MRSYGKLCVACVHVLLVGLLLGCVPSLASCASASNGASPPGPDDGGGAALDAAAADGDLTLLTAQGAEFVRRRACGDCHQSSGVHDGVLSGQTTARPGTSSYPANLTPDPDTGLDDWTDAQIIRAMREGKDEEGADLCAIMPRFKDMGDAEARAIAAYLKSLPPVHHAIPESTCGDAPGDAATR
jgi:cytochrome c1